MGIYKSDILQDTWIYQEIKEQIQQEEQRQHHTEQSQMFLAIVRARFPRIEMLAQQAVKNIIDPAQLRTLIVTVSIARTEKEARQALKTIEETKQAKGAPDRQ